LKSLLRVALQRRDICEKVYTSNSKTAWKKPQIQSEGQEMAVVVACSGGHGLLTN